MPAEVVARGGTLYRANGCAICHGPGGHGNGPSARAFDPPPRDLSDLAEYTGGTTQQEIADTLATGIGGPPRPRMPGYSHLSEDDRLALAGFVLSISNRGD